MQQNNEILMVNDDTRQTIKYNNHKNPIVFYGWQFEGTLSKQMERDRFIRSIATICGGF